MGSMTLKDACIVNGGAGNWAFAPLARQLAEALGIEICERPRRFNYFLSCENREDWDQSASFIPQHSVQIAADKREIAKAFKRAHVPRPETHLLNHYSEIQDLLRREPRREWCLKFPTGCGASGHRLITETDSEPSRWPRPFVVQEFVRMDEPTVYRAYCAGGELFGWMVRCFPQGQPASPWVAHAKGARYHSAGFAPREAIAAAAKAIDACGLTESFGCADLIQRANGEWLALEVGTDGFFNHVDRDLGDPGFEEELLHRIAKAFWDCAEARREGQSASSD
jgi:hypothetical protein